MTIHMEFLALCIICAPVPCKEIFLISHTQDKTEHTMKVNQYETNSKNNILDVLGIIFLLIIIRVCMLPTKEHSDSQMLVQI